MSIDWSNPPKPGVFCQVTLKKVHLENTEPAILTQRMLVVRGSPESKKAASLSLDDLLYYVRRAALEHPLFRDELDRMMTSLPPVSKPPKNYDHEPAYQYSDFRHDSGRKCLICGEEHEEQLSDEIVALLRDPA